MSEEEIRGGESDVGCWKGTEERVQNYVLVLDSNKVSVQEIQFFKDMIILD